MKIAVFSTKTYDQKFFEKWNQTYSNEITYFKPRLSRQTAKLAYGFPVICTFVNDKLDQPLLKDLKNNGLQLIALRCAGFNQVDLKACEELKITVVRVPAYSPHAVAEHTLTLILGLNRKLHRAYNRIREGNFKLEGLLGFDLHDKTVGIIGTGKIGVITAQIIKNGFGSRVVAFDPFENPTMKELGVPYVTLDQLYAQSDVISLHCPLTPDTYHLINETSIQKMKQGVMIVNTSRGAVIDASAVVEGLKSGKVGGLAIDVYEEEGDLFFEDLSDKIIQDDVFTRLLTFPNVLITGHQSFFTEHALNAIAETTLNNIAEFAKKQPLSNQVTLQLHQ